MSLPRIDSPQPESVPFSVAECGVRVRVRVTPRARKAGITGVKADAEGRPWLEVAVTAAPENGRANEALLKILAHAWRLPRRALRIAQGAGDRRKTVAVEGEGVLDTLQRWHQTFLGAGGY
jgi:uncharacterized protein (TIGR00251 family)